MASKRTAPSAIPKVSTPIPVQLSTQRARSPPPPPSPPPITLKDLQDAVAQNARNNEQCFEKIEQKTEQLFKQHKEELYENLSTIFQGLAAHIDGVIERVDEVEQKVDSNEHRLEYVEEGLDVVQNQILIGQFREMEFAIRIRGLAENPKENLREQIAAALAAEMGCGPEIMYDEMERAYRVNSWIARQRNLPRDVVVYFTRKTRRNEIMQQFYQQRFQILSQDVLILKEIPPKILRGRRDFAFLIQELKICQLVFRWDIPTGVILTYAGKCYRLNTVKKAKDFLTTVLQADLPSTSSNDDMPEQLIVDLPVPPASGVKSPQLSDGKNYKGQRMTRAAYRHREKEQQKETVTATATASPPTTEPVGGARPKSSSTAGLMLGLFQKLQKPKDG